MVVKKETRSCPAPSLLSAGDKAITHKVMAPPDAKAMSLQWCWTAVYHREPLLTFSSWTALRGLLTMTQKWPSSVARPSARRFLGSEALITGQRILDTMFPLARAARQPFRRFGTGKTMTQHQVAKWSDADVIIYIGCGERGNEMTQVLEEFSELIDPKTEIR